MFRVHRYIEHYHPGYLKRIGRRVLNKFGEVVGAYQATRRVLTHPYKVSESVKSSFPESDMPAVRSRSRGRKRVRSVSATPKSGRKSMSVSRSVSKNPRSLSTLRRSRSGSSVVKAKKSVSFVPTHSTGYVGRFKKPKLVKRKRASRYDKYGSVLKKELSGTVEDNECVYVGHGTPVQQAVMQMWRAVYRRLMAKAGYDFRSWSDVPDLQDAYIQVRWSYGIATAITTADTSFDHPNKTHLDVASDIAANVATTIPDTNQESIQFQEIILYHVEDTGASNYPIALARINLMNFHITFDYYSILKIKNVTLANAATNANDIDNIDAQPLVGRSYKTSEWANGFEVLKPNSSARAIVTADHAGGNIFVYPSNLGVNGDFNEFKKPPPAYGFGVKRSSAVRINPAEIKSNVVKWKATMKLNTAVQKLLQNVGKLTAGDALRPFGVACMFGLEREVEVGVRINSIQVAYQVDFVFKCVGKEVQTCVLPITDTAL